MKKWTPALIAVFVFAVFSLAPEARFLEWDDAANLLNNDKWRGLSWEHLKWMLTTRHYGPWQPLSWFSWAIDYSLWGLDAAGFRRTNVLLHSLTAAFAYLCFRRRLSLWPAAGAALFFAVHPLRVESVVWITERRDVLSGLFAVLSIWAWLEGKKGWSRAAFVLAVLSKGTAIAVVPFLWFLDPKGRDESLAPHAVIGFLAACMNLGGFATGDVHAVSLGMLDRLLVAASGAWFYLWKTIVPMRLSPYYALALDEGTIRLQAIPGALAALAVTGLCFHKKVRAWAVPLWCAYLLALAPVSGLLQNGRQAAADRYSYLACLPFALLFGFALAKLKERSAAAAACAVSVLLAVLTAGQSGYWKDDVTLWTRAVDVQPGAYLPNSNLSVALMTAGMKDEAVPYLENAMALEPRDAEARVNLASIVAAKDPSRAMDLFREALDLRPGDPTFASARFNLGLLLVRAGRKSDGLAQMREAVLLDPSLAAAISASPGGPSRAGGRPRSSGPGSASRDRARRGQGPSPRN